MHPENAKFEKHCLPRAKNPFSGFPPIRFHSANKKSHDSLHDNLIT